MHAIILIQFFFIGFTVVNADSLKAIELIATKDSRQKMEAQSR